MAQYNSVCRHVLGSQPVNRYSFEKMNDFSFPLPGNKTKRDVEFRQSRHNVSFARKVANGVS